MNKNEYCREELGKVKGVGMVRALGAHVSASERMRHEANAEKIDWLAAAIATMGGIAPAAKRLKVSRGTVYNWLDLGLSKATLETLTAISKHGKAPIEYLIHRIGPFKGTGSVQQGTTCLTFSVGRGPRGTDRNFGHYRISC